MHDNLAIWIAILPAIVISMAPLLMARKDPQREKALDGYARKVNLAMTPQVRPRVVARLRSYEKAAMIGAAVGVAVGLPVMIIVGAIGAPAWSDNLPLGIIVSVCLGMTCGPVFSSVGRALRPDPGRRIARPTAPTAADYVPPLERLSAPFGVGISALALIVGAVLLSTGVLPSNDFDLLGLLLSPGAVIGYFGLLLWIGTIVVERLLLRTGQIAGSEQELAWDDALRAMTLRGVVVLPFAVSTMATLLIFFTVISQTTGVSSTMTAIGGFAFFGYLTAVCIGVALDVAQTPGQHYWRRLWKQRTEQPA